MQTPADYSDSLVLNTPPDAMSGEFDPDAPRGPLGWPTITYMRTDHLAYPWHRGPALVSVNFSGVCYGEAGNRTFYGDVGSVVLLEGSGRRFGVAGPAPVEQVSFFFSEEFIRSALAELGRSAGMALEPEERDSGCERPAPVLTSFQTALTPAIRRIAAVARDALGKGYAQALRLEEMRMAFFAEIACLRNLVPPASTPASKFGAEIRRRLDLARSLLHDCFNESLPLERIATHARISPYHLLRQFKRVFGLTPNQYQTQLRLDLAKRLLRSGHCSVGEVCHAVGYESVSTFSSLFSRCVGIPPNHYQRLSTYEPWKLRLPSATDRGHFWISAFANPFKKRSESME